MINIIPCIIFNIIYISLYNIYHLNLNFVYHLKSSMYIYFFITQNPFVYHNYQTHRQVGNLGNLVHCPSSFYLLNRFHLYVQHHSLDSYPERKRHRFVISFCHLLLWRCSTRDMNDIFINNLHSATVYVRLYIIYIISCAR